MLKIRSTIKAKQLSQGSISTQSLKEAFRNEDGAIDLASIMVGIIVIGLIGGVIAATVFAVIPWSQDNAAKHQLDSIVAAQSAYMGLSSDSPPVLPAGHKANSFADSASLASANLLQAGSTYCAVITDDGKGYQGLSQSASGKVWSVLDTNTKPVNLGQGSIAPDCSFSASPLTGEEGSDENGSETGNENETPYIDPTPTKTILTYKCNTFQTGSLPFKTDMTGTLTITGDDGTKFEKSYTQHHYDTYAMKTGVTYSVVFDGTYKDFSGISDLSKCVTSMDHWGMGTGVTSAHSAFHGAANLTSVPERIPSSITNLAGVFNTALLINDPNISKWDVSNVTHFGTAFNGAKAFDQPLNDWDMSKATSISSMFSSGIYSQPLDKWDVSKVESMNSIFANNKVFNQPLNSWKTTSATSMVGIFNGATKFDQPLNNWDVSQVTTTDSMFKDATAFNQDLSSWTPVKAEDMDYMFYGANSFVQDLSSWKFYVRIPAHQAFTSTGFPSLYLPTWVKTTP